jgi:hypothetical protein
MTQNERSRRQREMCNYDRKSYVNPFEMIYNSILSFQIMTNTMQSAGPCFFTYFAMYLSRNALANLQFAPHAWYD